VSPWTNSLFENGPGRCPRHPAALGSGPVTPIGDLWVFGGDGAIVRHIGFQSLSRLVASGHDIKVLVLGTPASTRTPVGQTSTASFTAQVSKLSAYGKAEHGKQEKRKELGRILMAHGDA